MRVRWLALGALAWPLGVLIGHLLHRRSLLYPTILRKAVTDG